MALFLAVLLSVICAVGCYTLFVDDSKDESDFDEGDSDEENEGDFDGGEEMTVYNGTWGDNGTWEVNLDTKVLTINGTGAMEDYSNKYNVPWSDYTTYSISTIEISPEITHIGAYCFYGFGIVKEIVLPDALTSIGKEAFRQCSNLTAITIPKKVTSIDAGAFRGCSKLTEITFLGPQPTLGERSFHLGASNVHVSATIYSNGWASSSVFTTKVIDLYTTLTYVTVSFNPEIPVNVGGTWKTATPYVNVGGEWKEVTEAYVNVGGTWKEVGK